jgi:Zn finger protein HypA/HybF involved in hydrogenase expression
MKLEKLEIPEVEISCPDCNHKFKAQLGELREAQPLTCPSCHREIIDAGSYGKFLEGLSNVS